MRVTHSWTDETATIRIEGLSRPVRMVHLTDAHVALIDERDAEHVEDCQKTCELFRTIHKTEDGTAMPSDVTFNETMDDVKRLKPDLLALTGDIIHFPSQACLDHVMAGLEGLDIPVLYTAGNHDWHYPGVEGRGELREACWPLLDSLHKGEPACSRYTDGQIQWISIDNSTYQINEEQLEFATQHLANLMPTVLLIHIPLSLPTLRDDTLARWNAPILIGDPDWDLESRDRWGTDNDLNTTLEFVRVVTSAQNMIAAFCGHVHFHHVDAMGPSALQYVGGPGFSGAKRLVEFLPM